jgi:hypothetical protein
MTPPTIAAIVEGFGEVTALPPLLHRIAHTMGLYDLYVPRPFRVNRTSILNEHGVNETALAETLDLLVGYLPSRDRGAILILLDSDEQDPLTWEPQLLAAAHRARPDVQIGAAMATRQYENWFLASLATLASEQGVTPPREPEQMADAKTFLREHVLSGDRYIERHHHKRFTRMMDLELAARCPSFVRFRETAERLLDHVTSGRK